MLRPSGDPAALPVAPSCVRRNGLSLPITFTYRSAEFPPFHAKAIWLPSGENVGDHAFPGRAVRGTTVSLWRSYSLSSRSIFGFIHGYSVPAMTTQAAAAIVALRFQDRKSTRLNSSHGYISYAVFCLKKKNRCLE